MQKVEEQKNTLFTLSFSLFDFSCSFFSLDLSFRVFCASRLKRSRIDPRESNRRKGMLKKEIKQTSY